ncbi:hypothetical protein [uncultured Chitinophaga sp.]|jgi:hypothetical protein|uniref:hypothetical protein n=1 Tax=uncultured Chitinophaga sp. TaxID=339340 RepID=UPI00260FDA64|nr:hypothetical protein [uncultured Chitinophaga sp.]
MQIDQLNILAVGLNAEIMAVVNRLINGHEQWKGTTVCTIAEAIAAFSKEQYHIVLLCAGICEETASQLKTTLAGLSPATIVIRHFGGGSGLLESEILSALSQHNIRLN